jgi:hypothetical protein
MEFGFGPGRGFEMRIFVNNSPTRTMLNVQYVTDSKGKPLYVQLPIKDYEKLLANADELADIAAYKKAKKKPGKAVPFDEAFAQIEAQQKKQAS